MNITELIVKLDDIRAENGDLEVGRANFDADYGYTRQPLDELEVIGMDPVARGEYQDPKIGAPGSLKIVVLW